MAVIDFETECWDDPFFQSLTPLGRYLFIYLWTNPHKNIAGLYTITMETISHETRLSSKQINSLFPEMFPKVKYDPVKSVCWVVKHVRRQFLRTGIISEQIKKGIRKVALKLRYHPFLGEFIDQYPEIFDPQEKETLYRPSVDPTIGTPLDLPGGGEGEGGGKGSVLNTQNSIGELSRRSPSTQPDEEFWNEVRKIYHWLDIDLQIQKMKGHMLTPKGKDWKMTRRRVIAWLNREDRPVEVKENKESKKAPPVKAIDRDGTILEQGRDF
jgi:hypothetical protein